MPLNPHEEALLGNPSAADIDYNHQRLDQAPAERIKIGKWTLVALILNRTIGSGIFLTPHKILAGTGCVGGALFLWVIGAAISLCGLYVWLECGLSMPQRIVRGETEPRGVPRSGGEKNFVSWPSILYLCGVTDSSRSAGIYVSKHQRSPTTHQNYMCFQHHVCSTVQSERVSKRQVPPTHVLRLTSFKAMQFRSAYRS